MWEFDFHKHFNDMDRVKTPRGLTEKENSWKNEDSSPQNQKIVSQIEWK